MIDKAKKRGKLKSWFDVDPSVIERLDPLLEEYEEQCRAGLRPDRQPLLDLCSDDEQRALLQDELDHYDDYYPQTRNVAIDDTKRGRFERVHSEVPQTIGEYRILQTLGRGGFGVVLCAEHTQTNKRVALKVPHPGWQSRESFASLVREANALSTLNHEGIVRFHESKATPEGTWIISTEWIDGRNLEEIAKSESLSVQRVTEIILELLAALGYAHQRGIIHRDIKPSNVMVEKSGRVKLLDFGMAKIFDDPGFSQSGQLKGSIAYMSPEQASGDVHETNERSDIYAVGVLLYELLAGRRPFSGSEENVRRAIVGEPCPPLEEVAPHVPKTLALICHKALAKDQADRFQSTREFASALMDWQAGNAVTGLESITRELACALPTAAKGIPKELLLSRRPRLTAGLVYQVCMAIALVFVLAATVNYFWKSNENLANDTALLNPFELSDNTTQAERIERFWENYDRLVPRPVTVETNPPNAKVTFFPLDNLLVPNRERAVLAGTGPVNIELKPGIYLVVAALDDENFSEVYRQVPDLNRASNRNFKHTSWTVNGDRIQLPAINILPFDRTGMELCGEAWIDRELVTERLYFSIAYPQAENVAELSLNPTQGNDHDSALRFCELLGRRLPTVAELTASSQANLITCPAGMLEWTSTGKENVFQGMIHNPLYVTWSSTSVIPTDVTVARNYIGFRTARSLKPLTALNDN